MDSSNVKKHRARDDPTTTSSADGGTATTTAVGGDHDDDDAQKKAKRQRRVASAKRGLRSLSIAVSIPFSLALLNIYLFGTFTSTAPTKAWTPPLLALHLAFLASASVMGLSAWIVWAEGGFHRDPSALLSYVTLLVLGLAWDAIVFVLGADWAGLAVAIAAAGAVMRCRAVARRVNTMAADLVLLCLAWAGFSAFVNVRLLLASDH